MPGNYHFRALKIVGQMQVWLDLVVDSAAVPALRDEVLLKVTRVSLNIASSRPAPVPTQPPSQSSQVQKPAVTTSAAVVEQETKQSSAPSREVGRRASEKLISFDNFEESESAAPARECPARVLALTRDDAMMM